MENHQRGDNTTERGNLPCNNAKRCTRIIVTESYAMLDQLWSIPAARRNYISTISCYFHSFNLPIQFSWYHNFYTQRRILIRNYLCTHASSILIHICQREHARKHRRQSSDIQARLKLHFNVRTPEAQFKRRHIVSFHIHAHVGTIGIASRRSDINTGSFGKLPAQRVSKLLGFFHRIA